MLSDNAMNGMGVCDNLIFIRSTAGVIRSGFGVIINKAGLRTGWDGNVLCLHVMVLGSCQEQFYSPL